MSRLLPRAAAVVVAALLLPDPGATEVVDAGDTGFTVRTVVEIARTPEQVFDVLTTDIGQWWHPDHTFSGDASNLYLETRAGGVFGEHLPDGGSVRHLEVLYVDPGKLLRLGGGLGPLQGMAVSGALTIQLESVDDGTLLTLTYVVGGYAPAGLTGLAGPVDGVLAEQMARLKAHAEG